MLTFNKNPAIFFTIFLVIINRIGAQKFNLRNFKDTDYIDQASVHTRDGPIQPFPPATLYRMPAEMTEKVLVETRSEPYYVSRLKPFDDNFDSIEHIDTNRQAPPVDQTANKPAVQPAQSSKNNYSPPPQPNFSAKPFEAGLDMFSGITSIIKQVLQTLLKLFKSFFY